MFFNHILESHLTTFRSQKYGEKNEEKTKKIPGIRTWNI